MAPASTTARDGLGPHFDARSCSSCHFMDGRGNPHNNPSSLVIKISFLNNGEYQPVPSYGGQLTRFAIDEFEPEGSVKINQVNSPVLFPYNQLTENAYQINWLKGLPKSNTIISPRIAPHLIGLGLIEAIDEQSIYKKHDPDDKDGDGISGRVNLIESNNGEQTLGRFGWQAESPTVAFQVGKALINDMGITNLIFSENICEDNLGHTQCAKGVETEISQHLFDQLVLYSKALAVPRIRVDNKKFKAGLSLFNKVQCDSCHTPFYVTDDNHPETQFANKTIAPFTDLLLHDMGDQLADKDIDGNIYTTEWRTPPLWGIGLFDEVNKHTYFLHDGRAKSIHEAILWHGGEAKKSKELYTELNSNEKKQLIEFLNAI